MKRGDLVAVVMIRYEGPRKDGTDNYLTETDIPNVNAVGPETVADILRSAASDLEQAKVTE